MDSVISMKYDWPEDCYSGCPTFGQTFVVDLCTAAGRVGRTTKDDALFRAGPAWAKVATLVAVDASGTSENDGSPVLEASSFSSIKSTDIRGGSSGPAVSRMIALQNVP